MEKKQFDINKKPLKKASSYLTNALVAEHKNKLQLAEMYRQAAFGVKFKNGLR